jgi:hypothetical protein
MTLILLSFTFDIERLSLNFIYKLHFPKSEYLVKVCFIVLNFIILVKNKLGLSCAKLRLSWAIIQRLSCH